MPEETMWLDVMNDRKIKDEIIRLIQDEQLQKGIDSDGDILGYYSEFTEFITGGRKQAGDPYTLEDTGAFYDSMFVIVNSDSIVIDADGVKEDDDLFIKFGENIVGLTDENIEKIAEIIKEKYVEWLVQRLLQF